MWCPAPESLQESEGYKRAWESYTCYVNYIKIIARNMVSKTYRASGRYYAPQRQATDELKRP